MLHTRLLALTRAQNTHTYTQAGVPSLSLSLSLSLPNCRVCLRACYRQTIFCNRAPYPAPELGPKKKTWPEFCKNTNYAPACATIKLN
jgi:hypothetical protein